jgi:hypothetical protein
MVENIVLSNADIPTGKVHAVPPSTYTKRLCITERLQTAYNNSIIVVLITLASSDESVGDFGNW